MEDNQIKLGYWAIRGRGQMLRHLLSYIGCSWEDVAYPSPEKWFGSGDKNNLGLDFPNLPYLINGKFKLTESSAIAKYIARKYPKLNLMGKTPEDEATIEMVWFLLEDIFSPTYSIFFSPNYATERTRLFDGKIAEKLNQLEAFIGDKEFAVGYITIVDFKIAEAVHYFQKMYEDKFTKYKGIIRIQKNIETMESVKSYYKKEGAISEPFLPTYAQLKF